MPIQFACPSCARGYSVKDELAGKSAKCGQCGHKMTIPAAGAEVAAAAASSSKAATTKTAAAKSAAAAAKSLTAKSPAAKPTAAKPVTAKASVAPVAKAKPVKAAASDPGTSSWLDEELESSRVEAKSKPAARQTMTSDAECPSCAAPMASGAVICVKCGYDKRIRGRRSVEHVEEGEAAPKRSKLGHMGSLLRGSVFSFLGAMVGAIIWAVLAYFTHRSFGIVAWGLGGLAGFGMALGHDDDDGTFAGIIAGCMSILGVIAAKVFIVVILLAALAQAIVAELPVGPDGQGIDMVEFQRTALASSLAIKKLEAEGVELESFDDERFQAELELAKAEVAQLSEEEIVSRLEELDAEEAADEELVEGDEQFADEELGNEEEFVAAEDEDDEGPSIAALIGSLFRPMDGVWILLAFFTAYKVGSGQAED